jgi:hypothetical protein
VTHPGLVLPGFAPGREAFSVPAAVLVAPVRHPESSFLFHGGHLVDTVSLRTAFLAVLELPIKINW